MAVQWQKPSKPPTVYRRYAGRFCLAGDTVEDSATKLITDSDLKTDQVRSLVGMLIDTIS